MWKCCIVGGAEWRREKGAGTSVTVSTTFTKRKRKCCATGPGDVEATEKNEIPGAMRTVPIVNAESIVCFKSLILQPTEMGPIITPIL